MSRYTLRISDDEARRLWQRGAELQDEAERAAAERVAPARSLTAPADEERLDLEHATQVAEGAAVIPRR